MVNNKNNEVLKLLLELYDRDPNIYYIIYIKIILYL